MTTLNVGIASYQEMQARTMAIARGELHAKPDDPKVWFTSPESFAKLCQTAIGRCWLRSPRRTLRH